MPLSDILWVTLHGGAALALCLFGLHRLVLLYLYWRTRKAPPHQHPTFDELPPVAVQLPIYNEIHVARRVIRASAALDYPKDKLQVQVLDDSTDQTTEICQDEVARLKEEGLDITCIHRDNRQGYKAGALGEGLAKTKADLILILDADFLPPPTLLQDLVHHFADPDVGMVQARWEHLNRDQSLLTRLQAIFLDGHLIVEQVARHRGGGFFNFNGTAGIWRRAAIEDAGGWGHDTLTEDLDLSYRAQLAGWKFIYRPDVAVPAELPDTMAAFKSQQHRWAKGSTQTCRKLLPRIWREAPTLRPKLLATAHLTANLTYFPLLLLILVGYPAALLDSEGPARFFLLDAPLFLFATGSVVLFYLVSQAILKRPCPLGKVALVPGLIALGVGMAINNLRGVAEALAGHQTPFVRTPKQGTPEDSHPQKTPPYTSPRYWTAIIEAALALYFTALGIDAIRHAQWGLLPFLLLFALGFGYVVIASLAKTRSPTP